jgi:hypothetical protein
MRLSSTPRGIVSPPLIGQRGRTSVPSSMTPRLNYSWMERRTRISPTGTIERSPEEIPTGPLVTRLERRSEAPPNPIVGRLARQPR